MEDLQALDRQLHTCIYDRLDNVVVVVVVVVFVVVIVVVVVIIVVVVVVIDLDYHSKW